MFVLRRIILASIILIYSVLAALYAAFTPKWQAPDEPAHFNYIRHIAETGTLPVLQPGDFNLEYLEQIKAAKFPPSMSIDAIRYEAYQPPLYYLVATPLYLISRGAGIDTTVTALRLFSVALGVIVLLVAFNIIREIFPDDNLLALATVGVMATVPQHLAISASVSNDLAAELVLILILWLAVKRVKNTISNAQFTVWGGLLFGAALITKTTAYVPGAALLVVAELANLKLHTSRITFRTLSFTFYSFALALLIAAPMFIRGALTYSITDPLGIARHDAIVVGQMTTAQAIAESGLKNVVFKFGAVTFKSFWAQFGWMGVLINDRLYVALAMLCAMTLLGFTFYALRIFRGRAILANAQTWCVSLLIVLLVVAVVDYIAYNFKFFQPQGRYLFPALISIAFFFVVGLRELIAREYQPVVFALLYVGFIALDFVCLFWFIVPQLRIAFYALRFI